MHSNPLTMSRMVTLTRNGLLGVAPNIAYDKNPCLYVVAGFAKSYHESMVSLARSVLRVISLRDMQSMYEIILDYRYMR